MKLRVKDLDISTGDVFIAVLNNKDAEMLDLFCGDRILVKKGPRTTTTAIDITNSRRIVPPGSVGIFSELTEMLGLKDNDAVEISVTAKPKSVQFIKKKLHGGRLSQAEFDEIIWDVVHNRITRVELTYFVAACYIYELTIRETTYLTNSILKSGQIVKFNSYPVVDKHCVGGVAGNRTTMVVVPIVAAAGLTMPKTSSRSITSPAGTADTMEVLANVSLTIEQMKRVVKKTGGCMVWGGALNLAPADDKIISVEHEVSLDPKGQLLASILAKKKSVSTTHLLIDIPVGKTAKIRTRNDGLFLKRRFEKIGRILGFRMKVVLTDGRQPIGKGVGPHLEARDVLWVLRNDANAPKDLRAKSLMLAGLIFELAGKVKKGQGKRLAEEILDSGKAYKKLIEIVKAQGGWEIAPEAIRLGSCQFAVRAWKAGTVRHISNKEVSRLAKIAGAPDNAEAGVYLHAVMNQKVSRGDLLFTVYSACEEKLGYAKELLEHVRIMEVE